MVPEKDKNPLEIPEVHEPVEEPIVEPIVEPVVEEVHPVLEVEPEPEIEAASLPEKEPVFIPQPPPGTGVKREPLRSPTAKKSLWDRILPWVIVALVFFLGGLATIYFTMVRPMNAAAALSADANSAEITTLNTQINQLTIDKTKIENDLVLVREELVTAQDDLAAANVTIGELNVELSDAKTLSMVYQMLTNVNIARAAIEQGDAPSARQALTFAKADLAALKDSGLDEAVLSGFSDRLDEALSNLTEEGFATSRAALDTVFNNLLMLAKNLS